MLQIDELYPTPEALIEKMIDGIDLFTIETILEPSAGKGDIVDYLRKFYDDNKYERRNRHHYEWKPDIDCIEINTNLQYMLKGKGLRVVHDNFLTYKTFKQYDLIIMNPPFSDGDKHLLKALEMQKDGGKILCILNAETLKNLCTNSRKDLKRKLDETGATIEYIENAFTQAERKTGVEIAFIKIDIPKAEKTSFIFEQLRQEEETHREPGEQQQYNFLAQNDFIQAIVNQYILEVNAGVRLINEWDAMRPYILSGFDGKGGAMIKLTPESTNEYIKDVRRKYWTALFNNPNFTGLLTSNLQEQYHEKVNDLVNYDFSLFNIYTIKIEMNKSMLKGVEETIINLFEEFSNKHHWYDEMSKNIHYYNGWKTNKAYIVNKKVIIPLNGYSDWNQEMRVNDYRVTRKLADVEKVFNYLDDGLTKEVDIERALKIAQAHGTTQKIPLKYFYVTFYKKGTCHIEFKNLDLLKKFNIFGSQKKGWLPPSYGKMKYSEMVKEEKDVINEFEGETEYKRTMQNTAYFIYDASKVLKLEAGIGAAQAV